MKNNITLTLILLLIVPWNSYAQENADQYNLMINAIDWSPDGEELLYTCILLKKDYSNMAFDNWKLYEFDFQNDTHTLLASGILFASYSPSGNQIAYGKIEQKNMDIYVKTLSSGETRQLTTHPETDNAPVWSPDGSKIAFNSDRVGGKQLFIMNADGTHKRQITHSEDPEIKSFNPQWSPASNQILYFLEKGDQMDQIYLTDSDGSFFRNLTKNKNHNIYPTWTQESNILFTVGSEDDQIYKMNSDGSSAKPVKELKGTFAKQSPTGDILAYIGEEDEDNNGIYLYDFKNETKKKVVDKSVVMRIKNE